MQKKLSEIADVLAGYSFRKGIETEQFGKIILLQGRSVGSDNPITDVSQSVRISSEALRNPIFLQPNDILLVSRALEVGSFRSTVFKASDKNVTVSSSVYVVRLKGFDVLPEYISLYFNSTEGQNALADIATGAHIQMLSRKELMSLKIPILPLESQKLIVGLQENIRRQEQLAERKYVIKRNIINTTIKNLTHK